MNNSDTAKDSDFAKNGEMGSQKNLFAATGLIHKKLRAQKIVKWTFGSMSVAILIPLVALTSYLIIRAWPSLSWDFITDVPKQGMRSGGIWPALIGTMYTVTFSLLVAVPVGVMAGMEVGARVGAAVGARTTNVTGALRAISAPFES